MKFYLLLAALFVQTLVNAQLPDFVNYPVYKGNDLGLTYSRSVSVFRIWSPVAEKAELIFYREALGGNPEETMQMNRKQDGLWEAEVRGDQAGKFYVFRIYTGGKWLHEVPDPYARIVGVNGRRALVGDLTKTNPDGWDMDKSPSFGNTTDKTAGGNSTDAIIYELHVRDATIHESSGAKEKGKFNGLTERDTRNKQGLTTGLAHMKELGVTHVHLLPVYDFYSVDETRPDSLQYNWGYDPLNYNTPEGSYASNATDGLTRIREFKKLIKTFHDNGLRVVMDVVYNHTMLTEDSWFNQLVPGYYYRHKPDGSFSDATACGNETASEMPMFRKFMLESMKYWVEEYHVDGFRIDLMGVHDIATINMISAELHNIKPDILIYGEGWTAGSSPFPDSLRALKKNAYLLDRVAVFSDDIRDGIKGSVFDFKDRGFASGKPGMEESIRFGITAACRHPQVNYNKVNYSKAPYAREPFQTVTYAECHDNHVLWDKLAISAKEYPEEQRKEMHKLALSVVLTSQGISFLHAGTEFLRSKQGDENSYKSGDAINAIDWNLKSLNSDVYEYTKSLIGMRRNHPAFRLTSSELIRRHLRFLEKMPHGVIGYVLDGEAVGDEWKKIVVYFNGTSVARKIRLPESGLQPVVRHNQFGHYMKTGRSVTIEPFSCSVFKK